MTTLTSEARQQWVGWVQANVAPPFRKRALKAAMDSLTRGDSADQAIASAMQAVKNRAHYMATSALVLGAISAALGLFLGGVSLLATFFAFASVVQGRRSVDRAWQAWSGLGLAALGITFFVLRLVIH
jgi:hypothetical protein